MVPEKNLLIIKEKANNCQKYAPSLGILVKYWEKGGTSGSLIYVESAWLDLAAARSRAFGCAMGGSGLAVQWLGPSSSPQP